MSAEKFLKLPAKPDDINAAVAEHCQGWTNIVYHRSCRPVGTHPRDLNGPRSQIPGYLHDTAATMRAVEKYGQAILRFGAGKWVALLPPKTGLTDARGESESLTRAVCFSMLIAEGVEIIGEDK